MWLCTKDLSRLNFQQVRDDSPEELLVGIKQGRSTYAQVFDLLCTYAGLHSAIISGRAKGVDYEPGMKFEGKLGLHSWYLHLNSTLIIDNSRELLIFYY